MKETLSESFSLETTAFIYLFLRKAERHERWKLPLLYGYICLYFKMYTCTFCTLSNPSHLFKKRQKRWKCLALVVKLLVRAPVQGHVIYWEGWKLTIKS